MASIPDHMQWWNDARFGMFVHWGLPTVLQRGIWTQFWEHIPVAEYEEIAGRFNPRAYRPEEWVRTARDAGMKYMVITTRNHDGFCLFDTKTTDFNARKTGAGRDLLAGFAEACHKLDMPLGFYYSLQSWRQKGCLTRNVIGDADFYRPLVDEAHEQIRELMSNYGKVSVLWYDGLRPDSPEIWRSNEMNAMVRRLQPGIVINNRNGLEGDFGTPENVVTPESRPWEACWTTNDTWGYCPGDRNWKTTMALIDLLVSCAARGGNLLLNVPPDPDGRMPDDPVERLREVGIWMRANGKAIYGSERAPIAPGLGYASRKGNTLYFYVKRWAGSSLSVGWLNGTPTSARVLGTGQPVRVEKIGDRLFLRDLPEHAPDPWMPVIEVEFSDMPSVEDPQNHLMP